MVRIDLNLADPSDWVKIFDPRDQTVLVVTDQPPASGTAVRIDLSISNGGPRVILRGHVISRRDASGDVPSGCTVALGPNEREKINYLNGFVRGGLLNLRERRRLPLRLPVTYGGLNGPCETASRDINEEGMFVLSDQPLPEGSEIHLLLTVPSAPQPMSLVAVVTHTVVVEDEDVPGMGVVFQFSGDEQRNAFTAMVDELERALLAGRLPDAVLL